MNDPFRPIFLRENPIFNSNFDFSKKEQVAMKIAAGLAIVAFASEKEMLEFVQKNDGEVVDKFATTGEFLAPGNWQELSA